MKIVHVALAGPYTDNWSYQDNILPRVQHRQGHEVTVIATCFKHENDDRIVPTPPGDYHLDDGVRVIRVPLSQTGLRGKLNRFLRPYNIYPLLRSLQPDLIMLHSLGIGESNRQIERFIKENPTCILVGDNHMYNTLDAVRETTLKMRIIDRYYHNARKRLYPYYKKVFGITPACVDFAIKKYGIDASKVALLPLGFDPELCLWQQRDMIRKAFREKHGIKEEETVIIHGGKIIPRRKTPETIQAVQMLNSAKVRLVIFGAISPEMKPLVEPLLEKYKENVLYLGSVKPEVYNEAYLASDLALFPGGQSVLWQEAIGCGLPILVGNDDYLDYLNQGGNAEFIDDTSICGIYKKLTEVLAPEKYHAMKLAAENDGRDFFSYERIAKLITDCVE